MTDLSIIRKYEGMKLKAYKCPPCFLIIKVSLPTHLFPLQGQIQK